MSAARINPRFPRGTVATGTPTLRFVFDGFVLDAAERELTLASQPGKRWTRAFDALLVLVERRDRAVSSDELLALAWRGWVVEENNRQSYG